MEKIKLDKYYTPDDVVDLCLNTLNDLFKRNGFTPSRIIEPSAGAGAFSKKVKGCLAFDIEPEDDSIKKADFLKLDLDYLPDTLVLGNPPFGEKNKLAYAFYRKSIKIADYIAFVLPVSQYENSKSFYEFDLIKSIDLGIQNYSGRELHCCFNIYHRPAHGLNKRQKLDLECVKMVRQDSKKFNNFEYDLKIGHWGTGCAGKILKENENVSGMYKIKIKENFKEKVIHVLKNVDWKKELNSITMLSLKKYHIIELLKREIPDIY